MSEPPLLFSEVRVGPNHHPLFNFEVPANRCVSVVGDEKSGLDKLGEIALGLVAPASGRALVYGEDLSAMSNTDALAFRRRLGYLPADDGLMQNLTLGANIALPLQFCSNYSESAIQSRTGIIMSALRIGDSAARRPAEVSEVVRRRAATARALAFDPELVILERPFDGITNRAALELLQIVRGGETSQGSRRTVLIITHHVPRDLSSAVDVSYRVIEGELRLET